MVDQAEPHDAQAAKPSIYGKLRAEPRREYVSTLESVAAALTLCGEPPEIEVGLSRVFRTLVQRVRDAHIPRRGSTVAAADAPSARASRLGHADAGVASRRLVCRVRTDPWRWCYCRTPPSPPRSANGIPRSAEVAALLIEAVRAVAPELEAEHIGSSSVPGLAGKGYIDLQLATPAARIPALTEALVAAGWQRQRGAHAWPPERPMLIAELLAFDRRHRSHLHVVPEGAAELAACRAFRDALRAEPALRERYVARKRAVLAAGITDGSAYAEAKGETVVEILRELGF